jgi:hypothetical protein
MNYLIEVVRDNTVPKPIIENWLSSARFDDKEKEQIRLKSSNQN